MGFEGVKTITKFLLKRGTEASLWEWDINCITPLASPTLSCKSELFQKLNLLIIIDWHTVWRNNTATYGS